MATKIEQVESTRIGETYLVRIHTESGLTGLGQTACWGYPEAVQQIVERFASYWWGRIRFASSTTGRRTTAPGPFRGSALSGAVSAVDIALWDIKGKHFHAPGLGADGRPVQRPDPPAPADGGRRHPGRGRRACAGRRGAMLFYGIAVGRAVEITDR